MSRNSTLKSGGPARVRLVVLDAEIPDGDLGSLTQALQNALRSSNTTVVQRVVSNGSNAITNQTTVDDEVIEMDEAGEENAESDTAPRRAKQRSTRKPPKAPEVVTIEMNEEVSLAAFSAGKKSDSVHKKYLIAAAWLHEHRSIPAVTVDHIYTCFRSIGWPTNIPDFGQPLRELKTRKFFTTPERGHYAINHIGLDHVKKLGGSDGPA